MSLRYLVEKVGALCSTMLKPELGCFLPGRKKHSWHVTCLCFWRYLVSEGLQNRIMYMNSLKMHIFLENALLIGSDVH